MKIGSLCTGYGGLDLAAEAYFNAETIWCAEFDKYASQVIEQRFGIPNYGDIKTIDWASLPQIDILTAGYPCQPFSHAGQRKGTNDPRHIWPHIAESISILRPRFVILENVRGHLNLGFKEVLKDLAQLGFSARWGLIRASDTGAPHRRERLFVVAQPANANGIGGNLGEFEPKKWHQGQSQFEFGERSEIATNTDSHSCSQSRRTNRSIHGKTSKLINGSDRNEHRSSFEVVADTESGRSRIQSEQSQTPYSEFGNNIDIIGNTDDKCQSYDGQMSQLGRRFATRCEMRLRRAPNPLDLENKLNSKFVEYMMGLNDGWVTDCNLSRSQELKMLGNGVVPQQAYLALQLLVGNND